jgi:heterodisulfide reductase subunit C
MNHPESCIQCGTCVSVCPVEMVGGHAIVSFLADPDTTDYSVWLCTSCWRCQEACPEGVDIYGLMMEQRRAADRHAPAGYQAAFGCVLACGLALEVPQEELDQVRAAWELEPVRLPMPGVIQALLRAGK